MSTINGCPQKNLSWIANFAAGRLREYKFCSLRDSVDTDRPYEMAGEFRDTLEIIGKVADKLESKDCRKKDGEAVSKIVKHTLAAQKSRCGSNIMSSLGTYQGALAVLATVGESLTPGVIPAAAGKVLEGTEVRAYCNIKEADKEDQEFYRHQQTKKNHAMYASGTEALGIIAESVDCKTAADICRTNQGKAALEALKMLPVKKRHS